MKGRPDENVRRVEPARRIRRRAPSAAPGVVWPHVSLDAPPFRSYGSGMPGRSKLRAGALDRSCRTLAACRAFALRAFLFLPGCGQAGDDEALYAGAFLHGFVRDAETGEGIRGASVHFGTIDVLGGEKAFEVLEETSTTAVRAPRGYYRLAGLVEAGWQRVRVDADGYQSRVFYRRPNYDALCGAEPCSAENFLLRPEGTEHEKLPDLISDPRRLAEHELSNVCDGRDDVSICLRLPIGTANVGEGDLWLVAPRDDLTQVTQRAFDAGGSVRERPLPGASFIHHEGHGHIHFDNWSELVLRRIDPTCESEGTADKCDPIRLGEKLSFCLRDSRAVDDAFTPEQAYDCKIDASGLVSQGIGAGKMDLYKGDLIGQMFDVTGLEDGDYWIESHVNAHEVVEESDYSNNIARLRLRLDLPECGDGRVDYPESCEGADLGNRTCASLSPKFTGGKLGCNDSCGFDRSDCERALCQPKELGSKVGLRVAQGTNLGEFDAMDTYLCERPRGSGEDVAFSWTAPKTARYRFDTTESDYDTLLFVLDGGCSGKELACDPRHGESRVTLAVEAGQALLIVVDAYPGEAGRYVLNITEV